MQSIENSTCSTNSVSVQRLAEQSLVLSTCSELCHLQADRSLHAENSSVGYMDNSIPPKNLGNLGRLIFVFGMG